MAMLTSPFIKRLVDIKGADVNAVGENGWTAIDYAETMAPVSYLLRHGTNPVVVGNRGLTPLMCHAASAKNNLS